MSIKARVLRRCGLIRPLARLLSAVAVCAATAGRGIAQVDEKPTHGSAATLSKSKSRATPEAAETADEKRQRLITERFVALLEKNPRRGTALDRVYGYHVERGTLDAFLKHYQDRAERERDGASWMIVGLIESQRGRDAKAAAAFREAEQARPRDPLPPYYLGQSLVLVGRPDDAAPAFERAIARKPSRNDALEIFQALGRVHQRARHDDEALKVWNRLEALFPDDLRVRERIADVLNEESRADQALPRYEMLAEKVKDPYRKVQLSMEAADLKVKLGRTADALRDFERLLGKLDPESWLYREVRRKIDDVFLRNDDVAGLATYYESWIKKNPEDVEALARLGRILVSLGRVREARDWLEQAVKLAPKRRELRLALIDQLVSEKKTKEAERQYEELSLAEANNPDVIRAWGRMLLADASRPEAERKRAAAAVWRRMIDARKNDAVVVAQVAELMRQAELNDDAVALYKQAIELAPDAPQYREYLGEYYHNLKRNDEALAVWREIAAGKRKTSKTLARLAEVLSGFGFVKEALEPIAEACRLDADDFDLRMQHADVLARIAKHDQAQAQLDVAYALSDTEEKRDAVIDRRIATYQGAGALSRRIEALRAELTSGKDATSRRWVELARCQETDQKLPEAVASIRQALKLEPKSVPALTAAARIEESAGDLLGAVESLRGLTDLDRRARGEYLTAIARLESRLGRRGEAIKAGRELLTAAPGNPESHEFFADLCFQLGEIDEGLDVLRRSARANPGDPKVLLTLADGLSKQFRNDEAGEIYWRAFEVSKALDAKLGVVSKLAEIALQQNQFDKLIARLERLANEPDRTREATVCLAQAYQSSGDFGTARKTLERLIGTNARDSQLFQQLSVLSESEGDLDAAAKYERQVTEIAPTEESWNRLAALYTRAGRIDEAEAVWTKQATDDASKTSRVLAAIDSLLGRSKFQAVVGITNKLLAAEPNNWEALYREGVALFELGKTEEASRRLEALPALRVADDQESAIVTARRKSAASQPLGVTATTRALKTPRHPMRERLQAIRQIRVACGLEERSYYGPYASRFQWSPPEFGQARMAALGWLLNIAQKQDKEADFVKRLKSAADAGSDPRALWDWYDLAAVRNQMRACYRAAFKIARAAPTDVVALWAYLYHLSNRENGMNPALLGNAAPNGLLNDQAKPLARDELEFALACYKTLRTRRPEWVEIGILNNVVAELRRSKRDDERKAIVRDAVANANDPSSFSAILGSAASEGDVDVVLELIDRADRSPGDQFNNLLGSRYTNFGFVDNTQTIGKAMAVRTGPKKHEDIVRLLERMLAARLRHLKPGRAAGASMSSPYGRNYIQIWTNAKSARNVTVDFPAATSMFESGDIQLLRTAYEIYKRDDLVSDLTSRFRKSSTTGTELERLRNSIALAALCWWSEDKDEALTAMTRAEALSKGDPETRMQLAELLERRGDLNEALAIVDATEPLDTGSMRQRETSALRLSVSTGNIERARKAAERLFGLRLDTDTQIQLAAQMNQLGMHELAETVLARARRRAGNRSASLAGLMAQYQSQGKGDQAIQIARQILRRAPTSQMLPNYYNEDEQYRKQAMQVLARSNKLKEQIARLEEQAKATPGSLALRQALVDFYEAAGEGEKVKNELNELVKLKPDDMKQRYQVAYRLSQSGDNEGSLEHYRVIFKKEPRLLTQNFWVVTNAFTQAGKYEDLLKLVDDLEPSSFSNSWEVANILSNLLANPKTRDRGVAMFRKFWKGMKNDRESLLTNIQNEEVWQLPEIYASARESVLPKEDGEDVEPWRGLEGGLNFSGAGRITTSLSRLIDCAARQGKTRALTRDVEAALKRHPEWYGGQVLLGILQIRANAVEAGLKTLKTVIESRKDDMSSTVAWATAQEIDNFAQAADLCVALYQKQFTEEQQYIGLSLSNRPARPLINLFQRMGRLDDARRFILKAVRDNDNVYIYWDPAQGAARHANEVGEFADLMLDIGFPADAIRMFAAVAAEADKIPDPSQGQYYWPTKQQLIQQARLGIERSLKGLDAESLGRTVATLLQPRAQVSDDEPALDLVLFVQPRNLEEARVVSVLAQSVESASRDPALRARIRETTAKSLLDRPLDLSTRTAFALSSLAGGSNAEVDASLAALEQALRASPLEDLPTGKQPNARQRVAAARRLGVWVVARECWKQPRLRNVGDRLAAASLEAARRQVDPLWTLAMLREWAARDLELGDKPAAEARYRQMLEFVLENPAVRQRKPNAAVVAPGAIRAVPLRPATPAASTPTKAKKTALERRARRSRPDATLRIERSRRGSDRAPAFRLIRAAYQGAAAKAAPAVPAVTIIPSSPATVVTTRPGAATTAARSTASTLVSMTTIDRFNQAAEVAALAAENGMIQFSLSAIVDALKSGPPVGSSQVNSAFALAAATNRNVIRNGGNDPAVDPALIAVEVKLAELDAIWRRRGGPDAQVYQALSAIVLPDSRPREVFLYTNDGAMFQNDNFYPPGRAASTGASSVAERLCLRAVRAGKVDDLRRRAESRRAGAELPANTLLAMLGLAARDDALANEALEALANKLNAGATQDAALAASRAALPGLDRNETSAAAMNVIEAVEKALSANQQFEAAILYTRAARSLFRQGKVEQGRKQLTELVELQNRRVAAQGGWGLYQRKNNWSNIATEYARAGRWDDTWSALGEVVDLPPSPNGDPSVTGSLARLARSFEAKTAVDRYNLLKKWTFPTAQRRSLRLLAGSLGDQRPPRAFGVGAPPDDPSTLPRHDGLEGPTVWLIDAARASGQLDALAEDLKKLAEQKVENAEAMWLIAEAARGNANVVAPQVEALIEKRRNDKEKANEFLPGNGDANPRRDEEVAAELLACQCLERSELTAVGARLAESIARSTDFAQRLKPAIDLARAREAGAGAVVSRNDPELSFWTPVCLEATASGDGSPRSTIWVASAGHVAAYPARGLTLLLLKTPVTGSFEFSVDISESIAGLTYGGVMVLPSGPSAGAASEIGQDGVGGFGGNYYQSEASRALSFRRWTLRVEPGLARYYINNVLVHEDRAASAAAPWLAVAARPGGILRLRNPSWKGAATIPAEVKLCPGETLAGWDPSLYGETKVVLTRELTPIRQAYEMTSKSKRPEDRDWSARDGVIIGRRGEPSIASRPAPSRLAYTRPLLAGDVLSYEFYHEPGATHVDPALGRVAFLLEPKGVRLRRLVDEPDGDWTGLSADNAVEVPNERRGPNALPLRPNAWNAVEVSMTQGSAIVRLNGALIYEHALKAGDDTVFSLFHDRNATEARVRKVVLRGAWGAGPVLSGTADAFAFQTSDRSLDERLAARVLIGPEVLAESAGDVVERARALPPAQRLAALERWVLPFEGRAGVQVDGVFTPTNPVPASTGVRDRAPAAAATARRVWTGAELRSPAVEWVAAMKAAGRLDELAAKVAKIATRDESERRSQLALLVMVRAAQGRDAELAAGLKELRSYAAKLRKEDGEWTRRPLLIAAMSAAERPSARADAVALLDAVVAPPEKEDVGLQFNRAVYNGNGGRPAVVYEAPNRLWDTVVAHARSLAEAGDASSGSDPKPAARPNPAWWSPSAHATAKTRSEGYPAPDWTVRTGSIAHRPGHNDDFLYLNTPLRGDFEFECVVSTGPARDLALLYGGTSVAPRGDDRKKVEVAAIGSNPRALTLDTPLDDGKTERLLKLRVRDDLATVTLDGKKALEFSVAPDGDPWLALFSRSARRGEAKSFKIGGRPVIPESVELASAIDLAGWYADVYGESAQGDNADWEKRGDEIFSRKLKPEDRAGNPYGGRRRFNLNVDSEVEDAPEPPALRTWRESLLQYHRPLFEDGVIAYEFFYDPGKAMVHPALDRLAFLIEPDGVATHRLTDAPHDRSGLAPDNRDVDRSIRRGPAAPPLKARAWNQVAIEVKGDVATIRLNGVEAAQRTLEPSNQRTFGLFHYPELSEVRVRRVVMTGAWPRTPPQSADLNPPTTSK